MVVQTNDKNPTRASRKRKFRVEIVRMNGVIEYQKIGFAEIRTLYKKKQEEGIKITIRSGFINLVLDHAMSLAEKQASSAEVKRITLVPED